MRIIYPTGIQVQYYGRNPIYTNRGYFSAGRAPFVDTILQSYTCPNNRMAVVTGLFVGLMRITVAAPVGVAYLRWILDAGAASAYMASAETLGNNIGDKDKIVNPGPLYLTKTDTISLHGQDASTGGTISYSAGCYIVEYDP